MERLPNELLLHIFDYFSFNELRAVVSTCSRWRALGERCREFWADIQTPTSLPFVSTGRDQPTPASELACRRISRTNGQNFTLHLRGLFPGFLAAVAQHLHHVKHLEVELTQAGDMDEFTADWSRIEHLELLNGCWELASQTSWPLADVPHIVSEHTECETFPFIAPGRLTSAHIVFEDDSPIGACLHLGNEDWTFSRTCSLSEFDLSPGETEDGFAEYYYNFQVDHSLAHTRPIQSATVPAGVWELCAYILGQVSSLKALRIVLETDGGALPTLGYGRRLVCANLTTLILRADGDLSLPTRVSYEDAARFAMRELGGLSFPLHLRLENVELVGERGREFTACFNAVAIADAGSWSYLTLKARNPWSDSA
ncbi:hypothetical protein AURDEDRAFT_124090 [Auricularia subglabra TFB-10046 SS5]|nr:hypothetical protein AURDEDRAFT_124090 [Auricularia subglabra TFB-10046 SS5]